MKTLNTIQVAIVLTAALVSTSVQAQGDRIASGGFLNSWVAEVVYDNPAHNRGIHSYPNPLAPVVVAEKDMIYVDKAYGQAIYSYPRNTK
ncbi:hypothetical protein RO575_11235 [Methylomonas sp. MO1]|uniref:hypothetical protein n=1 Tax=unclassified Methylomonas TaxID=2608980 RepID=UPI0003783A8B|nr:MULTISPECIES: hypothetical protein [unclassified Methylomonas]MDT4290132.1 hypothetical protein [Methylomonas sp. MO1]